MTYVQGTYEPYGDSEEDEFAIADAFTVEEETNIFIRVLGHLREREDPHHSPFKWEYVAKPADENPFVGYQSPAVSRKSYQDTTLVKIMDDAYTFAHCTLFTSLPCKPADTNTLSSRTRIETVFPNWKRLEGRGYRKTDNETQTGRSVLDISNELSGPLDEPEGGSMFNSVERLKTDLTRSEFDDVEKVREGATAIVAQDIPHAHPDVCSLLPSFLSANKVTSFLSVCPSDSMYHASTQQITPPSLGLN